jgi:molybdopterin/thiamine biosynthesis adenylyltransferase
MATQKYDRFKGAPWFQEDVRPAVLIGGAGGIGSWLTLLLNRAGFETHVFDFDSLEAVNMAGQCFMHKSIGKSKVEALGDVVREICQEEIIPYNEEVTADTMTNDIVFSAFDNMKARSIMFHKWKEENRNNKQAIFIDGRLTMEQLTIFCIKGGNQVEIEEYISKHLFDDSEVEEMDCTLKQTSHGAAMIAAHMVAKFTNWYAGILGKDTSRDYPFFWEYIIPIGYTSSYEVEVDNSVQAVTEVFDEVGPEELHQLGTTEETDLTEEEVNELYKEMQNSRMFMPQNQVPLDQWGQPVITGTAGELPVPDSRLFYNREESDKSEEELYNDLINELDSLEKEEIQDRNEDSSSLELPSSEPEEDPSDIDIPEDPTDDHTNELPF